MRTMIDAMNRLGSMLLRLALMLFGLMVVASVVVTGVLVASIVIAWALLRGRGMPPVSFRWKGPVDWRRAGSRGPAPRDAEVVDVEVREVDRPGPPSPVPRLGETDRR